MPKRVDEGTEVSSTSTHLLLGTFFDQSILCKSVCKEVSLYSFIGFVVCSFSPFSQIPHITLLFSIRTKMILKTHFINIQHTGSLINTKPVTS